MTRRFTGWHMTAILIAFFGVVIAVNMWLAIAARSTFGGTLAENGYVANQDYNKWIADSAAQDRLGWAIDAGAVAGRLQITVRGINNPAVEVVLRHPLGREAERRIVLTRMEDGRFVSATPLPAGRWRAHVDVSKDGRHALFIREVRS